MFYNYVYVFGEYIFVVRGGVIYMFNIVVGQYVLLWEYFDIEKLVVLEVEDVIIDVGEELKEDVEMEFVVLVFDGFFVKW